MNTLKIFFIPLVVAFLISSCGSVTDSGKEKLIIGIGESDDSERNFQKIEAITSYFSKKLDMEVSHVLVSNSSAMIEAMRADKIDVGSGGPFSYLVAAKNAGAEAIITTQAPEGMPSYYRSCLITKPDSPVNNMEDLKKHAGKLTFSWAYPTSCSGHLVPRYNMQEHGIYPEDFKEVQVSSSHTSAIFTVLSGKVDVAAVNNNGLQRFIQEGRIKEDEFKMIWRSEKLLPSPVFVKKSMDETLKKKVQDAYFDMKKDDPETWAILRNQYMLEVEYIRVSDADYQQFRDMANEIKGLNVDY